MLLEALIHIELQAGIGKDPKEGGSYPFVKPHKALCAQRACQDSPDSKPRSSRGTALYQSTCAAKARKSLELH